MKAQDKPKYVVEARKLLGSLDLESLVSNPNNLTNISTINRLITIFTNFPFNEGQKLEFFNLDEINQLDLAGYFTEYFLEYKNQIKEIVENNIAPEKRLLWLV